MNMRKILLETSARCDYAGNEGLRAQAAVINRAELEKVISRMQTRALVLTHAFEVFDAGVCLHPMQAFLHASECITAPDGSRLTDSEFYHLLGTWGKLCDSVSERAEGAQQAFSAQQVNEQQSSFDLFARRFMQAE